MKGKVLILCLIVEILIFVLGIEFCNPFPINEIKESHDVVLLTILLYAASCLCGIFAAKGYGILKDDHMVEIGFLCLFVSFLAPLWPIILGGIFVFTLVLFILEKMKSSVS